MTKVRVGTTAKGIFAIVSALLVVSGTLIGVRNTSMQEASLLGEALCEQQVREHVRRFLTTTISWEGASAVPADPGPLNNTLYVFRDLPGFWKKVEALEAAMAAFLGSGQSKLAAYAACERHLIRETNHEELTYTEPQFNLLMNNVFVAKAYVRKLLDLASSDILKKPAADVPIATLAQFSDVSELDSGAIYAALDLAIRRPGDGFCTARGQQLIAEMNERHDRVGGLNWPEITSSKLSNAMRGRYGRDIGGLTPGAFEKHYKDQLKLFEDRLATISASRAVHVADWLPDLKLKLVSQWYPLCVAAGYLLILYLIQRLSRNAREPGAEVDLEDPGFPTNLLMPHRGTVSALFCISLLLLPAVSVVAFTVWDREIVALALKATEDFYCGDLGVSISRPNVASRLLSQTSSIGLAWAGVLLCLGTAIAATIAGVRLHFCLINRTYPPT